jgi:hypothetical protein
VRYLGGADGFAAGEGPETPGNSVIHSNVLLSSQLPSSLNDYSIWRSYQQIREEGLDEVKSWHRQLVANKKQIDG